MPVIDKVPEPEPEVIELPKDAFYLEGCKYYFGLGYPRNYTLALENFEKSVASENNADNMVYLSEFYMYGYAGITSASRDTLANTSASVLSRSRTGRNDRAVDYSRMTAEVRLERIFEYLEQARSLRHLEAQYRLASLLLIREMDAPLLLRALTPGSTVQVYSHGVLRRVLEEVYCTDADVDPLDATGADELPQQESSAADDGERSAVMRTVSTSRAAAPSSSTLGGTAQTQSQTLARGNLLLKIQRKQQQTRQDVINEAVQLYVEAAAAGHPAAQRQYGLVCELIGNYGDAVEW